ncbi:MAG TPA: FecR family protein [Rhodocyclaceae bacterium]
MRRRRAFRLPLLQAALAMLLWSLAAATHAETAATVTEIAGMVAETDAAGRTRVLAIQSAVASGSVLRTAADSHARLKFGDGTDVVLRPDTEFRLDRFRFEPAKPEDDNFAVRLIKGGFRQVTGLLAKRNPRAMDIRAAGATIGIRGTDFAVRICEDDCGGDAAAAATPAAPAGPASEERSGVYVLVHDGLVSVAQAGADILLAKGQAGFADMNDGPPRTLGAPPPVLRNDDLLGRTPARQGCTP